MLVGELAQLWCTHQRAVVIDDLADGPRWGEPGQSGEIDGGLGVPWPTQHPPNGRAQRERHGPDG